MLTSNWLTVYANAYESGNKPQKLTSTEAHNLMFKKR